MINNMKAGNYLKVLNIDIINNLRLNRRILSAHNLIEGTPFAFDIVDMKPLRWELESTRQTTNCRNTIICQST